MSLKHSNRAHLKSVIISTVIPQLLRHCRELEFSQPFPSPHARAVDLADLLLQSDHRAAFELIRESQRGLAWIHLLYGQLIEPAARRLGDLWSKSSCTEMDVAVGLSRLQMAVNLFATHEDPCLPPDGARFTALIVPEPGELHRLGAILDQDVLARAGWDAQVSWPADDNALQDLVAAHWFDVLNLSLSVAFRRDHWLKRVKTTIRRARQASLNPTLLVLVGGRICFEMRDAASAVGADLSSKTATHVDHLILKKMDQRRGH